METFQKLINYFNRNPLLPEYCFGLFSPDNQTTAYQPNHLESSFSNYSEFTRLNELASHDKGGSLINQPNTALMCTILCLGTFLGAYYLRIFRNSHYLGRSARRAFGDFGVPISIIIFVLIDFLTGVKTEKLLVPEGMTPTKPDRSWLVMPSSDVPAWMMMAACVPALLVYILVFMETQISE